MGRMQAVIVGLVPPDGNRLSYGLVTIRPERSIPGRQGASGWSAVSRQRRRSVPWNSVAAIRRWKGRLRPDFPRQLPQPGIPARLPDPSRQDLHRRDGPARMPAEAGSTDVAPG